MRGSSPPPLAPALAAVVVVVGLWAGAAPALGAVAAPSDCAASRGALAAARQKADPETIASLERQVARECNGAGATPTSTPKPEPSTSAPTSKPSSPGQGGGNGHGDQGGGHSGPTTPEDSDSGHAGDDKVCRDFMSQAEAQRYFDALSTADPERKFLDRDHDGKPCASLADVGGKGSDLPAKVDPDTEVDQTADDGSTATTSGSQVKDVPEGSVDTGGVQ